MTEVVPGYYHKFKCIADKCEHSCCVGWEIGIDPETAEQYQRLASPLGERIRKSIEGNPPHFVLGAGERCPMLREDGLCEIICTAGEDALCEICTLHPRFRNFYDSFCETGLGLCCEEAARIILTEEEPFSLSVPEEVSLTEEEQVFFGIRERILEILREREVSVKERFSCLANRWGFSLESSLEEMRRKYLALERLDDGWTALLQGIKDFPFDGSIFEEPEVQVPMEQLAVYFIFRHLSGALWDGAYAARVRFALMSCYFLGALWEKARQETGTIEGQTMINLARMYSAEVEYSEENMEVLLTE